METSQLLLGKEGDAPFVRDSLVEQEGVVLVAGEVGTMSTVLWGL